MKHFLALFFVALLTIALLFFISNPEILEDIWLWLIGFVGYIILFFEKGFKALAQVFGSSIKHLSPATRNEILANQNFTQRINELKSKVALNAVPHPTPQDSTITVMRYLDDSETTLGLIYINSDFFAYSLEDTHREDKVPGKTRIPAGRYHLRFRKTKSPLTLSYRKRFSWFTYHLELQEVPGFSNVYLHIGNTHHDTDGCLLIADGVNSAQLNRMITSSRLAYERFYKKISALLNVNESITIRILDEDWFELAKLHPNDEKSVQPHLV